MKKIVSMMLVSLLIFNFFTGFLTGSIKASAEGIADNEMGPKDIEGVIGYWKFDETMGNTIKNEIEDYGCCQGRIAGSSAYFKPGKIGNSLYMEPNQNDSYVTIDATEGTGLYNPKKGEMTVSFWIYREYTEPFPDKPAETSADRGTIISKRSGDFGWCIMGYYKPIDVTDPTTGRTVKKYSIATETYGFGADGKMKDIIVDYSSTILEYGKWQHVTVIFGRTDPTPTKKIYVNGVLDDGATNRVWEQAGGPWQADDEINNVGADLRIGQQGGRNTFGEPAFYWDGKIDEVAIYNRALTEREIKTVYVFDMQNEEQNVDSFDVVEVENGVEITAYKGTANIVNIPATIYGKPVISIGNSAFKECNSLTAVTVPTTSSLKSLSDYAFSGCRFLTSITFPSSLTSIGNSAFLGCNSLTTVTIPPTSNLTSIGDYAFSGCSALTSIAFQGSLTSIGNFAFSGCSALTSITFPNSLTSIGNSTFKGCNSLTAVTIPPTSNLTSLGDYAFSGCSALTSITFPNSLTSIGNSAFKGCNSLTAVKIPPTSNLTSLGDYAFSGCSALTSITFPNSLISIGNSAFSDCSRLSSVTIPPTSSLTSIGGIAFSGCVCLTTITIPSGVTSIGDSTLSGCSNLNSINVHEDNQFYASIDGVLFDKAISKIIQYPKAKTTAEYIIPSSVKDIGSFTGCCYLTKVTIPSGVTMIGLYAFTGCKNLSCVDIPDSVSTILRFAFKNCSSLTSITLPSKINAIYQETFAGCSSLTNITLPPKIKIIEDNAFDGCSNLLSIEIPFGVTSIGNYAFGGCNNLKNITIPSSVTTIGSGVFWVCGALTAINVDASNSNYSSINGVLYNKDITNLIQYPEGKTELEYTLPSSITTISNSAITQCSYLTSIKVEEGNTYFASVDGVLFSKNLSTLIKYPCGKASTEYIIPNNITNFAGGAFSYSQNLNSVTIPSGLTYGNSLENPMFFGCTGLNSIIVNVDNPYYSSINGVLFNKDATRLIVYPAGKKDENYTIPNTVVSIDFAFNNCVSLSSLEIPSSVKYIGNLYYSNPEPLVFWNSSKLSSINVDANNAYFKSIDGVLYNKEATILMLYPMGKNSTEFTIPDGTIQINPNAFSKCDSLKKLTLPKSIKTILSSFGNSNNVSFYGYKGSYAEVYALTYNIPFSYLAEKPVITIEAYDGITLTNKDITVNAKTDKGTLNATSHTFTENGSFEFIATDEEGNETRKTITISNIDKIAPTAPNITTDKTAPTNTILTVTINYPTDIISSQYKIDNGSWMNYSGQFTISKNATIYARCQDEAGNWSPEGCLKISNIDYNSPVVEGVENNVTYHENRTITFKDAENYSWATLDGIAFASGGIVDAEGVHKLVVTDAANNKKIITFTIQKNISETYLRVSNPVAVSGENVTIDVFIGNASNVMGMIIILEYDSAQLEYVSSSVNNQMLGNGIYTVNNIVEKKQVRLNWVSDGVLNDSGKLYSVVFKVKRETQGKIPVIINPTGSEICDVNFNTIPTTIINGSVTVGLPRIPLESISLDKSTLTLMKGQKATLNLLITPDNTTDDKTVVWSSANESVATVDSNGVVKTIGVGESIIIANVGGKIATCSIIVTVPSITIDKYNTNLTNENITVTASALSGTLNATSHTFTENGSFEFIATDEVGNETKQIVTISNIDKIAPVVEGVSNNCTYCNEVMISFNEGTATLNGADFANGSRVSLLNNYTLIVTDLAGNKNIVTFTITNIFKGDVNGDDDVTIADAMKVFQSLSGKIPELVGPEKEAADINGDGEVTIADAMKIFQYLSGKIASL